MCHTVPMACACGAGDHVCLNITLVCYRHRCNQLISPAPLHQIPLLWIINISSLWPHWAINLKGILLKGRLY